jgi:ATP-dependent RNA helicase DDX18/HAS1
LLIDDTFGPQLRTVGVAAPVETTQFVFVTATLPDSVVETVQREFPNVHEIRGPGLHRVAATVKEHLVDVSIPSANNRNEDMCFEMKAKQLLKALRQHRCERTLVFCNTVESCRAVENLLKRADRKGQLRHVGAYHNAMNPEARNRNLDTFAHGKPKFNENQNPKQGSNSSSGRQRRQQQQYQDTVDVNQILVCTDRAARGVDFDAAPVNHVVLFDFPKDPAEYVRRVGRTARAGRNGVSTVFAYGWQLPIARKIMASKLGSFSIAANDTDDEESSKEYKGGVQSRKDQGHRSGGKRVPQNRDKDKMLKGNIYSDTLY